MDYQMDLFFDILNRDITLLQESKLKNIKQMVKKLTNFSERTRTDWVAIKSQMRKRNGSLANLSSQQIHDSSIDLTDKLVKLNKNVNEFMNETSKKFTKKKNKDSWQMSWLHNDLFFSYFFFLDCLHDYGITYVVCSSYPVHLIVDHQIRKITLFHIQHELDSKVTDADTE